MPQVLPKQLLVSFMKYWKYRLVDLAGLSDSI